jgi:hypothetical protein
MHANVRGLEDPFTGPGMATIPQAYHVPSGRDRAPTVEDVEDETIIMARFNKLKNDLKVMAGNICVLRVKIAYLKIQRRIKADQDERELLRAEEQLFNAECDIKDLESRAKEDETRIMDLETELFARESDLHEEKKKNLRLEAELFARESDLHEEKKKNLRLEAQIEKYQCLLHYLGVKHDALCDIVPCYQVKNL